MDNTEIMEVFQECYNRFWRKYRDLKREEFTDEVLSGIMQEAGGIMVKHNNRLCFGIMVSLLNEIDGRAGMDAYVAPIERKHNDS